MIFFFFFSFRPLITNHEVLFFRIDREEKRGKGKRERLLETICLLIISNYRPLRGEYNLEIAFFRRSKNVSLVKMIRQHVFPFFFKN